MVAGFAVYEELDTADGDCADEDHVDVTALMQNNFRINQSIISPVKTDHIALPF